ncbi:MAG: hypothetical protein LBM38_04290 [Clostridiales bacterium]|jgi:hypothetical protein|nr:hypothetical protein [Clostridiales bacterium]
MAIRETLKQDGIPYSGLSNTIEISLKQLQKILATPEADGSYIMAYVKDECVSYEKVTPTEINGIKRENHDPIRTYTLSSLLTKKLQKLGYDIENINFIGYVNDYKILLVSSELIKPPATNKTPAVIKYM